MTDKTDSKEREVLREAERLLRRDAESLREGHTTHANREDWTGEEEAKVGYDEYISAADALAALAGRATLAASAGSEPVAQPTEDVRKKIQSNTWDHFGAILPTLKAISRGDWYWGANSRCKYIEIRLDTRDGGCILYDRDRVRISPEQFAFQVGGDFGKMEPWPAYSGFTHPSPPEGAGWKPIETAPKYTEHGVRQHLMLGYAPDEIHEDGFVSQGYWMEAEEDAPDNMGHDGGWVDVHFDFFRCGRSFGAEAYRSAGTQPTHWMPLPAPPASEAKGASQ